MSLNRPTRWTATAIVAACALSWAMAQSASPSADTTTGILLLAHGGGKDWNANVRSIAAQVNQSQPTEVAFGMADRSTLQAGIEKLEARGVKKIIAVPLFISSHSSVIDSTQYLLGLRLDVPADLKVFASMNMSHGDGAMSHGADAMAHGGAPHGDASHSDTTRADMAHGDMPHAAAPEDPSLKTKPVVASVPVQMAPALDHHAILAAILTDRAAAISQSPSKEVVILVAHGPNGDKENVMWLADLNIVAKQIAEQKPFVRVEATTVRDDADEPVRNAAAAQLRSMVGEADDQGHRVLIVPVLLSYGGIENGIRQRLDGVDHTMSPAGLLPDPQIVDWVKESGIQPAVVSHN